MNAHTARQSLVCEDPIAPVCPCDVCARCADDVLPGEEDPRAFNDLGEIMHGFCAGLAFAEMDEVGEFGGRYARGSAEWADHINEQSRDDR